MYSCSLLLHSDTGFSASNTTNSSPKLITKHGPLPPLH
jgi:hypothetical protein